METRKKLFQGIVYVLLLLLAMLLLFYWYTVQNSRRIEQQNKNYALDSARQTAERIDGEFKNALNRLNTYAYFVGESMTGRTISAQKLKKMEKDSLFDAFCFIDSRGINYSSDGQTFDASNRDYFINGMQGKSGMTIIFDAGYDADSMVNFYAPVYCRGEIAGVLQGVYFASAYLRDMISSTYFGENADVFLCMLDGTVISSSDGKKYNHKLIDTLQESNIINKASANGAADIFQNGGEGVFICNTDSAMDNISVINLPNSDYVLVQAFPETVSQRMTKAANRAGIMLEMLLIGLFVIYIICLLIQAGKGKKMLEKENREMGYVINGVSTLFSRFIMVDFETDTYQYLAGTKPESSRIAESGNYKDLSEYYCSLLVEESERQEFAELIREDALISALEDQNDVRYEYRVMQDGEQEWEHMNIICLERKNGKACKVLYIRQNITAVKEKELRAQAQMSLANRKERQYRIAITSNALYTYEFNLTKDIIEQDIVYFDTDGRRISLLEKSGMELPCKAADWFEKRKQLIAEESIDEYCKTVNIGHLKESFEHGMAEVTADYWIHDFLGRKICVRQSFLMTSDDSGDILVMVVTKEITEQVRKQKEQTQALQDALMQAQHANKAKTTFLSNMSHDIRTPMNAIIGFTTIAVSHIDSKEQVRDCLQKVLSSSNHLLSLINDILDMSRIESGKVQINEQECNISELMHNLVNIIQPQVKAKQLELFIDTFEVTNEDVIADALKLNQVFINLLSNAVKYTPAGGTISFRIMQKTTFRHGYGDYIFIIKDNGIGMAQDFVTHIFEPFEREATTTKTGIEGTGLGMAITKNIVEMMNGSITVESEPGQGSTFTVEVSLKLQDVEKNAEQIRELEGLRALVVDDDFNTCDSVNKMLKQIGLRSEWTTSGREAVYRAKSAYEEGDAYHTYIIDWQMPEMSGLEVARKIRGVVGPDAPIIILTAYDWSDIEEDAKDAGITAFCAKPLFMSDLKSALLAANNLVDKEEKAAAWTMADFTGKRILLVEDIELNREIAEVILTEVGFVVESAPDGTNAVAMVKQSKEYYYDAVLMDVQMPIMNGYEATRTIRALPRNDVKTLPIIAMTANALEEDKEAALKNGMNAHIAKPIDTEVLMEILGQFVN